MKFKVSITRLVLLFLCQMSWLVGKSQDQPNIIFILIDDQRYDFLSFMGHDWIETPNIDRLAESSIYFDQAYVTTSLCSPSRASILTGQYAHAHNVRDNDTPLPEDTPTFPQVLQEGGYETAFFGKWHMGGENDMPRKGFDHWVSFRGQGPYHDPRFNINGERVNFEGYTPDLLTDLTMKYIEDKMGSDQPYCLYLSHKSIHEDFTPADRHRGRYKDQKIPEPDPISATATKPQWVRDQRVSWHGAERAFDQHNYESYQRFFQLYSECMLAVDESVGRITKKLEDIGELDNTVIIYFSDNGYMIGEHGLIDKRVMYEESIRVPAFVHWPSKIKSPSRSDKFVLNIDMGPTIIDIAGLEVPNSMHGKSFLPLLNGNESDWRTDFVYEYFIDPMAVQTPTIFGLRTKEYSYMTYHGVWDVYDLYDMESDPKQKTNLLGEIKYGLGYGDFLRHVKQQKPELYPMVEKLDDRIDEILKETGGSRKTDWGN